MTPANQEDWHYCPFAHPLMIRQFGCEKANEVTRRDGPAIACRDVIAHAACQSLFDVVLAASLSAQGLEHDLTQIPSSLLKKVQIGSILAIQQGLESARHSENRENLAQQSDTQVASIHAVVQAAHSENKSWSSLKLQPIIKFIDTFQLQRRRQSRKSR